VNRRYRPPASQLVPWLVISAFFVLIGLGQLGQPRQGVGGMIVDVLIAGIGMAGAALRLTTNVTLAPAEISYRSNFRRRAIPWPEAESFRVGRASGFGNWSCVVVGVRDGADVRIPIAGSRPYVERVIGEIRAYRAGLGAGTSGVSSR